MKEPLFKKGDIVVYDGVVATVEGVSPMAGAPDRFLCSLQSIHNPEMSCTIEDFRCEKYESDTDDFDDSDRLREADLDGSLIMHQVASMTDAHIGDGVIKYNR